MLIDGGAALDEKNNKSETPFNLAIDEEIKSLLSAKLKEEEENREKIKEENKA